MTLRDNLTPAGVPSKNYGKQFTYNASCLPAGPPSEKLDSARSDASSKTRQFMMGLKNHQTGPGVPLPLTNAQLRMSTMSQGTTGQIVTNPYSMHQT